MKTKIVILILSMVGIAKAQVVSFDELSTLLGYGEAWNGSGVATHYVLSSGGAYFKGSYTPHYSSALDYWSGWTVSASTNSTASGYNNDRSAIAGKGAGGSAKYAVQYGTQGGIRFAQAITVLGMQYTNVAYTYFSMKDGDGFAKKFGGTSGADPDYLKVKVHGYLLGARSTVGGIEFYLADYRSSVSGSDFLLQSWQKVDLSMFGSVDSLSFEMEGSDNGEFGLNTPAYFALDNISISGGSATLIDFENISFGGSHFKYPSIVRNTTTTSSFVRITTQYSYSSEYDYSSWAGFALSKVQNSTLSGFQNQYAAMPAQGARGTTLYAIGYADAAMDFASPRSIAGLYISNTAYAYWSMKNGDSFAKKFGGASGSDPDYFKVTIRGIGNADSVEAYLADFRSDDASQDYILSEWKYVPLESLGEVSGLRFSLSSSDNGSFGMNTPAYFALDEINAPAPLPTLLPTYPNGVKLLAYPQPAQDKVYITPALDGDRVMVYDVTGKLCLDTRLIGGVLRLDTLADGWYMVYLPAHQRSLKLMVRHE